MKRIQMFEDYDPWNTKPEAVAPTNPKIDSTPDLDDDFEEICWNSKSYNGEWCLSGPERSKSEAMKIAGEMKSEESGSPAEIDRLLPIDVFITVFAQKLNPHGWTLDFTPQDLDWSTSPGHHVNEAESGLPQMPKFLKDAGAIEDVSPQFGGPRTQQKRPNDCWSLEISPLGRGKSDRPLTIFFFPNGNFSFSWSAPESRSFLSGFSGKWQAGSSAQDLFKFAKFRLKGVKMQFTEMFGERLPT